MILPPLQYLRPASPAEAVTMLSDVAGSVVLAGGQTLLNMLKLDLAQPSALVDVHRIDGLRGVRTADDGTLVVGAATTYASLSAVRGHPVADMAAGLVDRQVRNLRARLQNDWRRPRFIATGPGRGYRFLPTFRNEAPSGS